MRFKRRRGGASPPTSTPVEAGLLAALAEDLLGLLGDGRRRPTQDPLAALVGLSSGPLHAARRPGAGRGCCPTPTPTTTRRRPREFRRFTEHDLRAGKRADAGDRARDARAAARRRRAAASLDRDQADAWLGTPQRPAAGARHPARGHRGHRRSSVPDDDPRAQALHVYGWLGWLQESLLSCLDPRSRSVAWRRCSSCPQAMVDQVARPRPPRPPRRVLRRHRRHATASRRGCSR